MYGMRAPAYFSGNPNKSSYLTNERLIQELEPIAKGDIRTAEPGSALAKHLDNLATETGYTFPVGKDAKISNKLIELGRPTGGYVRKNIERTSVTPDNFSGGLPNQVQSQYEAESEKKDRYNKGSASTEEIAKIKKEEDILPVDKATEKRIMRWNKGYATFDEQQSPEYKEFMAQKLQSLRGI